MFPERVRAREARASRFPSTNSPSYTSPFGYLLRPRRYTLPSSVSLHAMRNARARRDARVRYDPQLNTQALARQTVKIQTGAARDPFKSRGTRPRAARARVHGGR